MPTIDDTYEQQPDVDATGVEDQTEDRDIDERPGTATADEDQAEPDKDEEDGSGKSRAARQAARYRTELRDTKTQLEQASDALAAARRQLVESIAGKRLRNPEAIWKIYDDPGEFFGDDGRMDEGAVHQATNELIQTFSLKTGNAPVPSQGTGRPDLNTRPTGFASGFDHHNTQVAK